MHYSANFDAQSGALETYSAGMAGKVANGLVGAMEKSILLGDRCMLHDVSRLVLVGMLH